MVNKTKGLNFKLSILAGLIVTKTSDTYQESSWYDQIGTWLIVIILYHLFFKFCDWLDSK